MVKYSISAVFLFLAVNQHMWEAVLTFNHLTRIHPVYIRSHQVPAKNTQDKETNLMFWTQFLKNKKKKKSTAMISSKLSKSLGFGFMVLTAAPSAAATSTTGSGFNGIISCCPVSPAASSCALPGKEGTGKAQPSQN